MVKQVVMDLDQEVVEEDLNLQEDQVDLIAVKSEHSKVDQVLLVVVEDIMVDRVEILIMDVVPMVPVVVDRDILVDKLDILLLMQ